jgi:hypothetical protein
MNDSATASGHRWQKSGVPQKGWSLVGHTDHDPSRIECDMCGKTDIRHGYLLRHPNHPDAIEVGCECCGNLTDDYDTPRAHAKEIGRWLARRRTWVKSPKWGPCRGERYGVSVRENVRTYRARTVPGFFYRINRTFSSRVWPTEADARGAAFDALYPKPAVKAPACT